MSPNELERRVEEFKSDLQECERTPLPFLRRWLGCRVLKMLHNPGSGGGDESWPGFGETRAVAEAAARV